MQSKTLINISPTYKVSCAKHTLMRRSERFHCLILYRQSDLALLIVKLGPLNDSTCSSSINRSICAPKRHIYASSFNKCSYPSRAISDISKLVTISILVSSSSAFIDMPRSTLSYKNSWSQGRPSSSPVQSIVTCECHNHVVSV